MINQWGICFWMAVIYCVLCKNEDQRISAKMLSCKWRHSGRRCLTCSPALCCQEEWSTGLLQLSMLQFITAGDLAPLLVIFQRLWTVCRKLPIPQEIPYEKETEVPLVTLLLLPFQKAAPSSFHIAQRDELNPASNFTFISLSIKSPFFFVLGWPSAP